MSDEELTAIYNEANGIPPGKAPPITTQRIFTAMRFIAARQREIDKEICSNAGRTAYRQQARRMAFELAEKIGSQK